VDCYKNRGKRFHPDKLFEPGYNITVGSWYLADLLRQFNGNEVIALAAYNGGRAMSSAGLKKEFGTAVRPAWHRFLLARPVLSCSVR